MRRSKRRCRFEMLFKSVNLCLSLQARTSLEVLCVWGMDVAQQSALQDGWSAVCGTVLECEDIEDGGTRVWIRCRASPRSVNQRT